MSKDDLRAHAAIEFAKVLLAENARSVPKTLADSIVICAADMANQLAERLYPGETK